MTDNQKKLNYSFNDIVNNNSNNVVEQSVYDSFNNFILSSDVRVLGKLLFRFKFFEATKHLPGDIVELGVFKGTGVSTFLKFIEIFCTYSQKKIIGFDLFDSNNNVIDQYKNGETMKTVYARVNDNKLTYESVCDNIKNTKIDDSKYILVKGDVCVTSKKFVDENPGFRISLIYVDLDLDEPVYESLMNLWNRLLPGGYIVFDEYEYHKFDESNGVDRFMKEKNIEYNIISTDWLAPTSYMIKKNF